MCLGHEEGAHTNTDNERTSLVGRVRYQYLLPQIANSQQGALLYFLEQQVCVTANSLCSREVAINPMVPMFMVIARSLLLSSFLAITAGIAVASPALAESGSVSASSHNLPPKVYGKLYSRDVLRGATLKDVYTFNDKRTTSNGPAYANIVDGSSNFIKCTPPSGRTFAYALCYYSGPNAPTGTNSENPPLPCTMSQDGRYAHCTCYTITNEMAAGKVPYLVDINAISNLDIYKKTIEACGRDGEKCASGDIEPAVCEAINTNLLVPGADLISVFSTLYGQNYAVQGQDPMTNCTGKDAGVYAGCMTAPCEFTGKKDKNGNALVNCKCPIYNGPYQVGQANQSCDANQTAAGTSSKKGKINVWSAAYNPSGEALPPKSSSCIPDMAGTNGCPLYDSAKQPVYNATISSTSSLCQNVCASYDATMQPSTSVQVGYACDATLCTTIGIGQSGTSSPSVKAQAELAQQGCAGVGTMSNFQEVMLVEALANCSCCASQVCGCTGRNSTTNEKIGALNEAQRKQGIVPQCDINGTLCATL